MKRVYLILSVFCLVATAAQAGGGKTMSSNSSSNNTSVDNSSDTKWFVNAYTGLAFSMKAGVTNPNPELFNAVASDESDDRHLGKVSFVGVAVNRRIWCDWLSLGVAIESYQQFRYAAHHVAGTLATDTPNSEVLSVNFQRSFNVNHSNALFNVQFSLPEDWAWGCGSTNISPTFGAGVGVGLNEVRNFQALGFNAGPSSGSSLTNIATNSAIVTTVGLPNFKASVAWQANFGIKFQPEDSNVSFVVAYRYYNGGKFESASSFMLNDNTSTGSTPAAATAHQGNLVALAPWTGHIKTNQVILCLDFAF